MTRLAEIRARLAQATPAPWTTKKKSADTDGFSPQVVIAAVSRGMCIYAEPPGGISPLYNQDFIAHAPTDLTYFLALVEAGEAVVKAIWSVKFGYCGDVGNTVTGWPDVSRALTCYTAVQQEAS